MELVLSPIKDTVLCRDKLTNSFRQDLKCTSNAIQNKSNKSIEIEKSVSIKSYQS